MPNDSLGKAILRSWRANCREPISAVAAQQKKPISTVFDRWKALERSAVHKFTVLLDTAYIQHPLRVWFSVKFANEKECLRLVQENAHINTAYRTHRGFLIEFISRDLDQLHAFHTQIAQIGQVEQIPVLSYLVEEEFNTEITSDLDE